VLFGAEIVLGTMEQDDGEGLRRHTQGLDDRNTLLGQLVEGGSPSWCLLNEEVSKKRRRRRRRRRVKELCRRPPDLQTVKSFFALPVPMAFGGWMEPFLFI
jgi:hypothetical protein